MTPLKTKQKIIKNNSKIKNPRNSTSVFSFRISQFVQKEYNKLTLLDRKHIQVELAFLFEKLVNKKKKIHKTQTKLKRL